MIHHNGTLPAAGEIEIPFEDIQPELVTDEEEIAQQVQSEPEDEENATPEQLEKLAELEQKIIQLETEKNRIIYYQNR